MVLGGRNLIYRFLELLDQLQLYVVGGDSCCVDARGLMLLPTLLFFNSLLEVLEKLLLFCWSQSILSHCRADEGLRGLVYYGGRCVLLL